MSYALRPLLGNTSSYSSLTYIIISSDLYFITPGRIISTILMEYAAQIETDRHNVTANVTTERAGITTVSVIMNKMRCTQLKDMAVCACLLIFQIIN